LDNSLSEASSKGTVHRILRLLACFAERQQWTVNELAQHLDLPRPTVHRLVNLCKPLNFIDQRPDGRCEPGAGLHRLAGVLSANVPLHELARPVLHRIRDKTNETTFLTLLLRGELGMFFSLIASPNDPMRYAMETNHLWPLSWGAFGRSLLAFLSASEVEEVIRRAEPSPMDNRPLVASELKKSLKQIRELGYAHTYQQRTTRSHGIAAPFFSATGEVLGNIAVAIPDFRFGEHNFDELVELVSEGARELTTKLGGRQA
jgi:DNA-binding IclR family transcriptional regulator